MTELDVVTVRGLRKSYGSRVVLDRLDLDVHAGEILGLTGTNGAGKTTTVECVQGLRRPDSGTLRVLGYDPGTEAARMRPLLGSQLQDSGLPDRLRVAEAVDLFAGPQATDGGELLARFGLAERRRSAFSALSGGERQRLFLVLALLNRPRLVILDELTQGLDPAARRNVWDAIRQLHAGGTTVLLVTHEMAEAEALCDRIVVLRAGQVLASGTPGELVARHANVATVRFTWPDPPAALRLAVGMLHSRGEAGRTTPLPGVDGLPALVDRFRTAGADVTLAVDGDTSRLHAATGLTVYRITQEALTNAVKHAPGAPTVVTLTVGPAEVRLAVDSAGEPGTGAGLGMISIRERAESVGGSCAAGPGGSGWLVDATLPLAASRRLEGAA